MTRLIIVVEGQTEEEFVKSVLVPHLAPLGVFASATIVGKVTAQHRGTGGRGGGRYQRWRRDIQRILGGDPGAELRVSTLFDLYGLPSDFPGLAAPGGVVDTGARCDALTAALAEDIGDRRFLPYIQRHEFEALVLASLPSLSDLLDSQDDLAGLERLRSEIAETPPEDINDGPTTAPSKRLLSRIPSYGKTLHGPLAVEGTGLAALRARCPRFNDWVALLEGLSP